jgi:capsid protein
MREQFYQPIYEAWLEMAVLSGALNLPTYETEPERYEAVRWVFRGYSYVDPQKEINAQKAAVRSGFKTLADCVAENGGDLDELLVARQAELAKLDEMNIITDTDPSAVNGSGASQYKPINTIDAFGDTPPPSGDDAENVGDEESGNY